MNKLKALAKRDYTMEKLKSFQGNSKQIWGFINELIRGVHDKSSVISELKINGVRVTDHNDICNSFNDHFATVGVKVTSHIDLDSQAHKKYLKNRVTESLLLSPVTDMEIEKLIDRLPNKTSSGVDHVSNVLLKKLKACVRLPLMILVNQSLMLGEFPDKLKIARVMALHKNGAKDCLDNYRPISLLPVISKVLERAVNNRIVQFLKNNNVLCENQFGFREKHSTIHAVQTLVGEILTGFEKNFNCMTLFLDLRKCFDCCNHSIILSKLEHYGVRDTALNWFKSFLSKRQQFVTLNGFESTLRELTIGLPQGSVSSPLLMSIMNNDFKNCLKLSDCILFADDTTAFLFGRNIKFLYTKMQRELDLISDWMMANSLVINVKKTKLMIFSPKSIDVTHNGLVMMNNEIVEVVREFKFLGVWIDSHLEWCFHVNELLAKLNQLKFIFRKLSRDLPVHCLREMYFAFVHSRLSYGLVCWGSMLKKEYLDKLVKCQKSFIRIINKTRIHAESSPLFLRNKILKLTDMIDLEFLKTMLQYKNRTLPCKLHKLFLSKNHDKNTRNSETPNIIKHKSKIYNSSFLCKATLLWEKTTGYRTLSTQQNLIKTFKYEKFVKY